MDIAHFARAKEHLETCREKAAAIARGTNFAQSAKLWSEFLVEHHRWYTRMQQAFSKGASSAWFGKLVGKRKSDTLLQYLHMARHADEHGLDRVAETDHGRLVIGPGGGAQYIQSFVMLPNGQFFVSGTQNGGPLRVEDTPAHLKLKPVENYGVTYAVPNDNGGRQLTASTAAADCVRFMEAVVAEGKNFFD